MKKSIIALAMTVAAIMPATAQKQEGLVMTPPMGWNSWNKFHTDIDEEKIKGIVDALVETGLRDAGYIYVNLDDAWHGKRDSLGWIQCDPVRFPSGMKALADYVHSKGMKFGVYSDAGEQTCAMYPGSRGHEYQDAIQYAKWGVDYLKFDWFRQDLVGAEGAYTLMRDALYSTGRPIVFSICEWGENGTRKWAPRTGHLWRTGGDIGAYFSESPCHEKPILWCIENNNTYRECAGPNAWNDPDNLEVGNGMSINQDRAHFSLWCMMAAPLILGNDVRNMTPEVLAIVSNREAIAIDQDSLGIQGLRVKNENGLQYWFKPLMNDDWAFCVLNTNKIPAQITLDWSKDFNFTDELSRRSTDFSNITYGIRNIWTGKNDGKTDKARTITVPGEDVVMYRLIR
ncbi:glycoside hydrolase family 27 protein [uncultured Muribaculum sp.]|uniref:glycoside hydrolase family 27 protein n=1 Tax=uncultured Muribaculum sp. TaxID=1918613 RepID=UPI0025AA2723|nr:glycoside hydrolase family 27 protein [uncultured Muribaculum sp.]